jgi:hypothetical protein
MTRSRATCPPCANIISPSSTDEPVCREHTSAKHFNVPLSLGFALARTARRRIDTAPPSDLAVRLRNSWRARGRTRVQHSQGAVAISHSSRIFPATASKCLRGFYSLFHFNSIRTITVVRAGPGPCGTSLITGRYHWRGGKFVRVGGMEAALVL